MKHLLRITCCCLLAASAAFVTSCKDDDPKPDDGNGKGDRIELTAMHALGARTEHATDEDASGFRIVMSESEATGTADKPVFSAGKYATVVLYGSENVKYTLPAGTYPLVDGKPAAGKGDLAASSYGTADAGGGSERLLSGSVTVTHTEAGYKIELTAELTENRTLNCVYEGAIDFGKEQENPDPVYDVDLAAKYALGVVYSEVAEDGSSDFYLLLSDVEIAGDAEEPEVFGAGQLAVLDFCAIEREEGMLPEGTYQFTLEEPSDMKGMLDYSGYATTDESGEPTSEEPMYFSECTATVSYTDDGYKIEVSATLEDGRSFHGSYEGMIDFEQGGGGDITLPGLEGDVNTTFTLAEASYEGLTEMGMAQYKINLYDNDFDQNFVTTNRLTLTLFTAETDDPLQIATGRYTVNTSGAAGTLYPGSLDMNTFMIVGSYCEQTLVITPPDYTLLYGMIGDGTVNVALNGTQYTITAALTDAEGNSIRGTYTGEIEVENNSFYSTLEGDKQADVAGMPCEISYFADYYGVKGDNWSIFIGTEEDGTEAFQIELIAPMTGFDSGLPEGEYIVSDPESYPSSAGKICVPGVYGGGYLYESWYMGDYQDGYVFSMAPFATGKVTVARSGDQYTIGIDMYDDAQQPHHVTATWTGTPKISNESGAQPAPQIESRKRASAKATAKNGSVHDRVAAHAVKVQPTAPKSPRW